MMKIHCCVRSGTEACMISYHRLRFPAIPHSPIIQIMMVRNMDKTSPTANVFPDDEMTKKDTSANAAAKIIDRNGDGFTSKITSAVSRKYIPTIPPRKNQSERRGKEKPHFAKAARSRYPRVTKTNVIGLFFSIVRICCIRI